MKTEITTPKQVKASLLILFLCGMFFNGFSQSLTITTPDATFCEGGYRYIYANFTPPTNIQNYVGYQITDIRWYKSGPYGTTLIPSNLYGYLSCYAYETGRYYCQIDYSIKTSYQYVTSTYCCQSGPFGSCKKYCNNYATGYTTQNYYQLWSNNSCYITVKPKSYTTQHISICSNALPYNWNGYSLYSEGTYYKTLYNSVGCDSVVTLNLSVGTSGATSYDSAIVCSSGLPYSWNGLSLSTAGDYSQNFTSASGCDSIANFKLIVSAANTSSNYATTCSSSLPYLWNGISCDSSGTYSKIFNSPGGCDSVAVLNLTVHQTTSSVTNILACQNAVPFWWNNKLVNVGSDTVHLTNATGCDSIAIVNVTIKPVGTSTRTVNICPTGLPYAWNNSTYGTAGVYTQLFTTNSGCDSVATLNLIVNTPTSSTNNIGICQSALPYSWNGNSYTSAGTYSVHLINANGCDSVATLNLYINSTSSTTQSILVCQSSLPYLWNGNSYSTAGTYIAHLNNSNGCDSSVTLYLSVSSADSSSTSVTICRSQLPYSWNGLVCQQAGKYLVHLSTKKGCDSLAYLNLNVIAQVKKVTVQSSVSPNDSVCFSKPITFTAIPTIDSSLCNLSNNLFSFNWRKNNTEIRISNTVIYSSSTYIDSISKGNDSIFIYLLSTELPGTTNTYCTDGGFLIRSINTIVTKVKTPKVMPVITFRPTYPSYATIFDSKTGILDQGLISLCSVNDYLTAESNVTNGIWSAQDTNLIKITTSIVNNKQTAILKATGLNGVAKVLYKTNDNGCSITLTGTIAIDTINLLNNAIITGPSETCSGTIVQYTSSVSGGLWTTYNSGLYLQGTGRYGEFNAKIGSAFLPQNVYANTYIGYYKDHYNATGSCRSYIQKTVKIHPAPTAYPVINGPSSICVGSTAQFSSNFPIGYWSCTGGATVNGGTGEFKAGAAGGTYLLYNAVVNSMGCTNSTTKTITINPLPAVPLISFGSNAGNPTAGTGLSGQYCVGKKFTLVGNPTGGHFTFTNTATAIIADSLVSANNWWGTVKIVGVGTGNIVYTVTNASGCSNFRSMVGKGVACAGRGVDINSDATKPVFDFTMYPNPAKGYINLNVETLVGAGSIVVTDLYGKTVKSQPLSMGTNTVDIANLSKGFYLVSTITSEGKTTKKLVVE